MDHPITMLVVGAIMLLGMTWGIAWRVEKDTATCQKQGGTYLPNEGACVRGIEIIGRRQ